ncbi:MAG: beta strand repeat-containing protein, partial [Cyclobacteriaceae bacterium]
TTYTANTDFSAGTDLGSGQKCVFNGSGNSVAVTGLSPNTQYFVRVYEYNGAAAVESYNVNTGTNNPNNRFSLESEPTTDATALTFSSVTTTSMTVNLTPGNGSARMLIAFNGAIGFIPVDGTSYTANSNFTTATNQSGNGKIVGIGTGSSFNVTNLTANTSYTFKVVELNGTVGSGTENYFNGGTPLTGTQSTAANAPSTQASNINFSSVTPTSMTITWTNGNGGNRIVLVHEGAIVSTNPSNFNSYTASSNWSAPGSQIGVGNFVVYSGSGNSVSLTNLNPSQTYHVRVYEFSGTIGSGLENYNVNTASNNPGSQATVCAPPTVQATAITFGTINASTIDLNWVRGNGNNVIILARDGAAAAVNPTNGTSYTANAAFGSGTSITIPDNDYFTVYNGSGTSVTVTGLNGSTAYNFKAFEYNTTNTCYLQTSPPSNDATTGSADNTSTLTLGTGSVSISSIVNTQPASVMALQWTATDIGGDNISTRFTQLVVRPGPSNDITDFTQLILGAELYDNMGSGLQHGTAIITSNSITIPSINVGDINAFANAADLGTIPNNSSKIYTLKVWLKPSLGGSLPTTVDGLNLVLSVAAGDFTSVPGRGSFVPASTTNSGATNNAISVVATNLSFVQQPSTTANATIALATQPTLQATDVNNNRDLGFNNAVASVNTGTPANLNAAFTAFNFVNGIATFTDLRFNSVGTSTMTVTSNSITSPANASPITVSASTNVTAGGLLGLNPGPNLNNSTTNQAVFGFTLSTTGTTLNFTDVTITTSSDPDVAFKPTSIRLVRSTDNDFTTAGNNTVVSSTYTTPGNSIDFSPFVASINGSSSYFFIVADIQDSYPTPLPTIQLSLASTADFTVSLGGKTGTTPITGTNYTLQDLTPPTVSSIVSSSTVKLFGNQGISGTSVDFLVTFSEPIASGVDAGDFTISADPSVGYNATVGISGSGNTRTVTINGISGTGRISLGLTDDNSIVDVAGNTLAGASNGSVAPAYSSTQYYTITLPQPSNSVTAFSSSATSNSVTVNWNDAVAPAQQATHYLVRIKKSTSVFSPVTLTENTNDGVDYTDTNFADGTLATYVPYDASPTGTVTFNVTSGSTYNVEIYPLTYTVNYGVANWDYRFTSPLTGSETTPVSFLSSAVLNTLVVPISSLKTSAGNSADVMQFRIFDDGQDPILPNVMTLQLNGAGTERIIFKLRDQLTLAEGASVTGFTTSTGTIATAFYTGKGTTNTITLTSANNGDWNSTTTVSYSGSGNAIFSTLGPLQIIDSHPVAQAADQVVTFSTNGTFVVPAGVTNITVEAWGGGGAGGDGFAGINFNGGGGGGGGGYSRSFLAVTPGNSYNVTVGAGGPSTNLNGTASIFDSQVVALGGQGGTSANFISVGLGGLGAGLGVGDVVFAGGVGRNGFTSPVVTPFGGGGGSSAGISGNGNGAISNAGANAPTGGGDGGNGINIGTGQFGSLPGGGGGGTGNGLGGDGANGLVRITYSDPTPLTGTSDWDGDNADFKFSQLVINQGTGNSNGLGEVANWQDIIETGGAQLFDGTNTFTGTVNPTNITFSSIPSSSAANIGFIADANGAPSSKTYTLRIWLKPNLTSALAANIDGLNLAFSLSSASFSYNDGSGQSSRLIGVQPVLQSGGKEIEVVATKLDFTTSPNPTQLVLTAINSTSVAPDLSTTSLIRARDVNGNTDKDYSAPLTVTGAIASTLPATVTMTNGKANLSGVQYQNGGDGTLTATTSTTAANSLIPASGTSAVVTVNYSNTSTIQPGALTTPASFSSLNTSSFVQVFDFRVVDDNGSGGDGSPTRISQIVYTQGTGNDITNWTQAISQAQLWDGVLANPPITGTVSANSITFSGINTAGLGFINDNGTKNYRLYITLKPSLGGTLPDDIDNKNFVFEVLDENISLNALSSLFTGSEDENSGSANIAVNVIATKLQFDVNPTPVLLVGKDISSQPPVPVVEALDVNNNRDLNYNSSTVTVTNSLGLAMGNLPGSGSIISGVLTFPNNFKFNTSGIGATLTVAATGPSAVTNGTSTAFDVRGGNATTITAGALPEPAIVSSLIDLVNTPAGLA